VFPKFIFMASASDLTRNLLAELLALALAERGYDERLQIKLIGRPTPNLSYIQSDTTEPLHPQDTRILVVPLALGM
jgi:hypothetical protein